MKKTVRVIIEKEIEINIPDELLTDEFIAEFESGMFELDDEDKRDSLFKYVACMAAQGYGHVEGMGPIGSEFSKKHLEDPDDFIVTELTMDDVETEIVESE